MRTAFKAWLFYAQDRFAKKTARAELKRVKNHALKLQQEVAYAGQVRRWQTSSRAAEIFRIRIIILFFCSLATFGKLPRCRQAQIKKGVAPLKIVQE